MPELLKGRNVMTKIKALIGSALIAGAAALPLSSAQAWWGPWGPGWGGWGPWDGTGFGDFNMSFSGRGSGYGYGYPYYGYPYWGGPWGYPYGAYGYPYAYPPVVAPAAPQTESK